MCLTGMDFVCEHLIYILLAIFTVTIIFIYDQYEKEKERVIDEEMAAIRTKNHSSETANLFFSLEAALQCSCMQEHPPNVLYVDETGRTVCYMCLRFLNRGVNPSFRLIAVIEKFSLKAALKSLRDPAPAGSRKAISRDCDARVMHLHSYEEWKQIIKQELKCSLCIDTICDPVVTYCGHTFCRHCLETHLDYENACPLCRTRLMMFNIVTAPVCKGTQSILKLLGTKPHAVIHEEFGEDEIPLLFFDNEVVYPTLPYVREIIHPLCRRMIREVTLSGLNKFGMVIEDENKRPIFGTIVDVRDVVRCEDNTYLVTGVGLSRFLVTKSYKRNGYIVAEQEQLKDTAYTRSQMLKIRQLSMVLMVKRAPNKRKEDVHVAIPSINMWEPDWRMRADGPHWLWHRLANMSLNVEDQVHMLGCRSLLDRLIFVKGVYEAIESAQ